MLPIFIIAQLSHVTVQGDSSEMQAKRQLKASPSMLSQLHLVARCWCRDQLIKIGKTPHCSSLYSILVTKANWSHDSRPI